MSAPAVVAPTPTTFADGINSVLPQVDLGNPCWKSPLLSIRLEMER